MTEKERYATIGTWAECFNAEEGVSISEQSIGRRLANANVIGETARNRAGVILRNAYYSESDVRRSCVDLLGVTLQANKDGIIIVEGEQYGNLSSFSRFFELHPTTLKTELAKASAPTVEAKDVSGKIGCFYHVESLKALFEDILVLPKADEDGLIYVDGEIYGAIESMARYLDINPVLVGRRVRKASLQSIRGRGMKGHAILFYPESKIRELCQDRLEDLPQCGEDSVLEIEGEAHRTLANIAKLIGSHPSTVKKRIEENKIPVVRGKTWRNRILPFYRVSVVREHCADLIAKKSKK